MKASIRSKLSQLSVRKEEIDRVLATGSATQDLDSYRRITKELAEIEPLVRLYELHCRASADLSTAREMASDPQLKDFAESEMHVVQEELAKIELELQQQLLPRDPNDERSVFLEIRAGAGGDESGLFAGDLLRMYCRFAERQGWNVELVSRTSSEAGGFKEVICKISGRGVYSKLKFESGGHRVQRIPETETQGRIHTSACTVAVLPELDDVSDTVITPAEIRIDTFRASGAGGQHINKTDSAVRVTHLPTGIVVECQDDRSQHKNKAQALAVLSARIKDRQLRERAEKTATERRLLIGSGDRSERIRTYNFPQGRVSDHRINLTLYKIGQIMDGELDELIAALGTEYQAEQLAALGEDQ